LLTLLRFLDRITGVSGTLVAWLVIPLIIASCYEVVSRYVFGAPTMWAFEVAYMLMGTHFLIGMAYTLREDAHVRVDFFYGSLSAKKRALCDVFAYVVLMLPAALWLTAGFWQKVTIAYASQERSGMSAFNPVIWPFRLVLFTAFVLLVLQGIAKLIRAFRVLADQPIPEAPESQGDRL
jgi:TRAP-type mannitol/chloroaromatic compound transport system permease small subunit